jgi:hypothetical protein
LKRDVPGPPADAPGAVPVVVATMGPSEEIIESVPIVDSRRALAWLVSAPRDFRPPEPDWYYIYLTSQPTRFWNGDKLLLDAKEPAATIFPPGIEHLARLDGPAFVFGVSALDTAEIDPSEWPKTVTAARIEGALKGLGGRPLRLIVGGKLRNEEDWVDRDWSLDERGGDLTRQVLMNRADRFELQAMNEGAKKAAYAHRRTAEAFATFSDAQVFWRDTKEQFQPVKGPSVTVVSPPFCHAVAPSGMTYILLVSNDGWAIADDTAPCKISG